MPATPHKTLRMELILLLLLQLLYQHIFYLLFTFIHLQYLYLLYHVEHLHHHNSWGHSGTSSMNPQCINSLLTFFKHDRH